jgi:glycosyltransferase involved in cell wall biosynthesis
VGHVSDERLRIVHAVRSDSFAGVERSIALSTRALVELGHEVVVVGGDPAMMAAQLDGLGVDHMAAASTVDVAGALRAAGPVDVVHAHMTAAELAAVMTRRWHAAALAVTRHFAAPRGASRAGAFAASVIGRAGPVEIAISRYVADRIGVRSVVVHHGVPDHAPVALEPGTVLVAQRLEREKSTDVAIEAWARSGLASGGWQLVIAGYGAQRAVLEGLAKALGVGESVRFLGRVGDVDALRRKAAVQLAPPPGEHFGLSVLEAMACGLPVIAADGGAHRELLGEEPELLFEPGDVEAAAARMRALAHDAGRRRLIGSRLHARQRACFSLAAHGRAIVGVYRRALASSS